MPRHMNRGPAQVALRGDRPCACCPQPAARDSRLCTDCAQDLDHCLDPAFGGDPDRRIPASIPAYWARLDATPGSRHGSERRAPGFVSTPPCALDPVVMRDNRSKPDPVVPVWYTRLPNGQDALWKPHHESGGQPRPVELALANLAHELWDRGGYVGPELGNGDVTGGGVAGLAGWLHVHRDRIAAQDAAGPIVEFLTDIRRQLQNAVGDRAEKPVGRCPRLMPLPGALERFPCDGPIYTPTPRPDQPGDEVDATRRAVTSCERCGTGYSLLDLYRLRRSAEQLERTG